ncbi:DNA-J related domain-containing protein [Vibrio proteolyticus]|uniref:J domain-containing protein n=1 Tax=Vibrio proteolyticus NBRC 13287 TaxID=1219065 RepID=U3A103_VIBPR|nr:DNA-J related domain-containing protein [Vibrio proteolyticus]GAD67355.1 hypothetical protein VPR01S_07_01550 [Vibrio proteolyticus NBRC 13287]
MTEQHQLSEQFIHEIENPLLWPILEVLKEQPQGWKVHTLAACLSELELMPVLDSSPEKDLFKRNFLMMNALYQLQETLYPRQWLQVEAMDIELTYVFRSSGHVIDMEDPLREYYSDWHNYEAEEGEVKRLLNEFWTRYRDFVGSKEIGNLDKAKALRLFDLPLDATSAEIRKRWRKLALKWHPDRENGNSEQFRILCSAWNVLRSEY